jgi:hypothetical protein
MGAELAELLKQERRKPPRVWPRSAESKGYRRNRRSLPKLMTTVGLVTIFPRSLRPEHK